MRGGEVMKEKEKVPIYHKALLTIEEAAELTNIGQGRIRELVDKSTCEFVLMVGAKRLVKREKFIDFLNDRKVI